MHELRTKIAEWEGRGQAVAIATVVETWGSAPRPIGAKMAFSQNGEMVGSVSGGCVEAAVLEQGLQILADGQPELLRFGVSDVQAWAVGLSCGGRIEVFVEPLGS